MISDLKIGLEQWGVPKERIHFEVFGQSSLRKISQSKPRLDSYQIKIRFSKSNRTLTWNPEFETILEFA